MNEEEICVSVCVSALVKFFSFYLRVYIVFSYFFSIRYSWTSIFPFFMCCFTSLYIGIEVLSPRKLRAPVSRKRRRCVPSSSSSSADDSSSSEEWLPGRDEDVHVVRRGQSEERQNRAKILSALVGIPYI